MKNLKLMILATPVLILLSSCTTVQYEMADYETIKKSREGLQELANKLSIGSWNASVAGLSASTISDELQALEMKMEEDLRNQKKLK